MQTNSGDKLLIEIDLIEDWLHASSEPFDDWDWDGEELTLFLHGAPIEKYPREILAEVIQGFPDV